MVILFALNIRRLAGTVDRPGEEVNAVVLLRVRSRDIATDKGTVAGKCRMDASAAPVSAGSPPGPFRLTVFIFICAPAI